MSLQLRSIIENTLDDVLNIFNKYKINDDKQAENESEEEAFLKVPFKLNIVIKKNEAILIDIDMKYESFVDGINQAIDEIIQSLLVNEKNASNSFCRVEYLLFDNMSEYEPLSYLNMINTNDELIIEFKNKINDIIKMNMIAPERFFFYSFFYAFAYLDKNLYKFNCL
jgi:hypothetical protein